MGSCSACGGWLRLTGGRVGLHAVRRLRPVAPGSPVMVVYVSRARADRRCPGSGLPAEPLEVYRPQDDKAKIGRPRKHRRKVAA